jgi:hypothetical protein
MGYLFNIVKGFEHTLMNNNNKKQLQQQGRIGGVNLWSNNKKLITNNEGLVYYGADLLRLSKLSP